jgi:hypothetical protein
MARLNAHILVSETVWSAKGHHVLIKKLTREEYGLSNHEVVGALGPFEGHRQMNITART